MNRKLIVLLLCTIVIVALAALASILHDVEFQPARSLPRNAQPPSTVSLPYLGSLISETPLWKILLFWMAFVLNLVLLFILLPPEHRRRILRQMLTLAISALVLILALRYRLLEIPQVLIDPTGAAGQAAPNLPSGAASLAYSPPQITNWMRYVISLVVIWAIFVVLWFGLRWSRRSRTRLKSPLGAIATITRASLEDLAAGRQWNDVVIETYARMSEVVGIRRGLNRGYATTPREFASRLVEAGLPAEAVSVLTRLFESVRYGGRKSTDLDANEAKFCLESILRACGASA